MVWFFPSGHRRQPPIHLADISFFMQFMLVQESSLPKASGRQHKPYIANNDPPSTKPSQLVSRPQQKVTALHLQRQLRLHG